MSAAGDDRRYALYTCASGKLLKMKNLLAIILLLTVSTFAAFAQNNSTEQANPENS
ncbi:MAG: hypothetical protein H7Y37_08930 [Anaerolineae bacterium]|nr:hypothetical protein [Gloeobacterales cyanobacterium ES-bin-313]